MFNQMNTDVLSLIAAFIAGAGAKIKSQKLVEALITTETVPRHICALMSIRTKRMNVFKVR